VFRPLVTLDQTDGSQLLLTAVVPSTLTLRLLAHAVLLPTGVLLSAAILPSP
jgi:hypothetical protein